MTNRPIRYTLATTALALGLLASCDKGGDTDTNVPDEEALVGASTGGTEVVDEGQALDDRYGAREELPAKQEPKEKCKGKGKTRTCALEDPAPLVTAAHGARTFMGPMRWGMDPKTVLDQLAKQIEEEYEEKQKATNDANVQDANRKWKREQIEELAKSSIKFESAAHHKWGVSVIQYDYVDDQDEEMVWLKGATLKKFYFFKAGELWKINYAYSKQAFPGLGYEEVLDQKFKKWFGVSPEKKVKLDPKTNAPLLRYVQWNSKDGDRIRAFDMMDVHGVFLISMVKGDSEDFIGERLPNIVKDSDFDQDVADVIGGSDICYDSEGNMVEDAAACKKIRGE